MHSAVRARQNVKVLKKYTIYYFYFYCLLRRMEKLNSSFPINILPTLNA